MSGLFSHGSVLDYTSERADRWCREEVAVVIDGQAIDTFWQTGSESHVLTASELASASVRFNMTGWREVGAYQRHAPQEWSERHPSDRETITSQHGLSTRWFIRDESEPDVATMRANLEEAVIKAAGEVASAQMNLDWAKSQLTTFDKDRS